MDCYLTTPKLPFCPVPLFPLPKSWRRPVVHLPSSFSIILRASAHVPVSIMAKTSSDNCHVDVIGIGSRKDAVIDFCVGSPLASFSRVRFWTIDSRNSLKGRLLQKGTGEDLALGNMEFPFYLQRCCSAFILVASAGYSSDEIAALKLLNSVKSNGGLAVSVLLKPFSFEGKRRQQEVDDLVKKLQKWSHCYITVETDALLKIEKETLSEAIRIVNNAVLASIIIISTLTDNSHLKFLDAPHEEIKELQFPEIFKLFENYSESKIGYGAGYDIKSSISQAVFNCPFLTTDIKSSNGILIFNLASARTINGREVAPIVQTFRQISNCNKNLVFCGIHEPTLEQNIVVTTLLVLSCNEHNVPVCSGFLSRWVNHFVCFSSLLMRNWLKHNVDLPNDLILSMNHCGVSDVKCQSAFHIHDAVLVKYSPFRHTEKKFCTKTLVERKRDLTLSDVVDSIFDGFQFYEGDLQIEQPIQRNVGLRYSNPLLLSEKHLGYSEDNKKDTIDIFRFSSGVKYPEQYDDYCHHTEIESDSTGYGNMSLKKHSFPTKDALTSINLATVMATGFSACTNFEGQLFSSSTTKGILSARAASMLEAEREKEKNWTPLGLMEYRGGVYEGRCQGGLPEGKGRLSFSDGSFYDGMWHYGQRSGFGRFHFSNGDVFQGIWRDDFMHGKGWFYFLNGDRWFVSFWKGKPNGEGRLYSNNGSIFFGHFLNGWRHGKCLYLDANGMRWAEIWNDGVRVNQNKLGLQSGY